MGDDPPAHIIDLLGRMVAMGGSDLHLAVGRPPMVRLHGVLSPIGEEPLTSEVTRRHVYSALTDAQRSRYEEDWELDFALAVDGLGRFRGNAHYSRGAVEATFRFIPSVIPSLAELGHRQSIEKICEFRRGLVLVTGVPGSGKSTTLASIVQRIGRERKGVIITIEDPIEYLFEDTGGIVKQREVGGDTKSFASALRHIIRQDPDVILVGEMRDQETMQAAITAAETGHLVLATLHTIDAPKAIDRIVDAFPGDLQPQIIAQLANCLEAVVSQRLLPRADGPGRVLVSETLYANMAVRACIRERRHEQIVGLIEIGGREGMNTIDDSLAEACMARLVTKEDAVLYARDRGRIESLKLQPRNKR